MSLLFSPGDTRHEGGGGDQTDFQSVGENDGERSGFAVLMSPKN